MTEPVTINTTIGSGLDNRPVLADGYLGLIKINWENELLHLSPVARRIGVNVQLIFRKNLRVNAES